MCCVISFKLGNEAVTFQRAMWNKMKLASQTRIA
jgi:hypothetical protein